MAQNYTRQSTLSDGDTITASLFNDEYNQLVNAFTYSSTSASSTGHRHDGSAGQGGNIFKIGDLDFLNKIEVDSTNNRWGFYVEVSSAAVEQIRIQDGSIVPVTTNDIDLGTASLQFKDLYIDGTANVDSLTLTSGATVTTILDEDDLSSDSATALVTQQSVKAYIDAQVTAQDFDFQADTGGALSIDLDSETMTFTGGTGIDTSGSGNAVTFAIDSTVTTLTGSQTLTNKTLTTPVISSISNTGTLTLPTSTDTLVGRATTDTLTNKTLTSPDINTPDIDGGTIDGTVIGGTTPAAVSATTVSATGNITVGGTVDGRDVATDGTKLDGIEAGATGDQTAAEIRTLVEAATDSNVFTDADHTKLDGIEAGATGDQTNAEIRAAVEAATDSNVFTDADHSKLDGIEALADVTDTANVTAAGALMDSELTSIASVKALNQGVATTDSPTFAAVTVNGNVEFDGLSGTGAVTVTDILDQDDMSSNSATALATQQSIKAYVDSQVATADTLSEVLANGNTTGGTDIAVGTGDDITFADSSKAIFGAGSDLNIYHDGSNSYISETGTGNLIVGAGAGVFIKNKNLDENLLSATQNGSVQLFYDNAEKLQTTSTGIDVTGTAVTDGLTVDGNTTNLNYGKTFFTNGIGTNKWQIWNDNGGSDKFQLVDGDGHLVLQAEQSGDISFYEDTGTTAKFFWDASAESLGIGTTSPSASLELNVPTGDGLLINSADIGTIKMTLASGSQKNWGFATTNLAAGDFGLYQSNSNGGDPITAGTAKLYINSSGNVGIGNDAPTTLLHVGDGSSGAENIARIEGRTTVGGQEVGSLQFYQVTNAPDEFIGAEVQLQSGSGRSNSALVFNVSQASNTDASEAMRIDSSGLVAIGTSSPVSTAQLTVGGTSRIAPVSGNGLLFASGGSDRMFINTSGNIGIGTTSPAAKLHVKNTASNAIIKVETAGGLDSRLILDAPSASGAQSQIFFDASGTTAGSIQYTHNSGGTNFMTFHTGGSNAERMRLDSSGNLLVGKTSASVGTDGAQFLTGGYSGVSATSTTAFFANRNSTDGDVVEIGKNGVKIGSIGAKGGTAYLIGSSKGLRVSGSGVIPITTGGTNSDATYDIGDQAVRFKDLYLSGKAIVGAGSSSAPSITASNDTDAGLFWGGGFLGFTGGSSNQMRLDSSGNLLVGTTDTTLYNNTTGGGFKAGGDDRVDMAREADIVAMMNRTGNSDGTILQFRKDGSTVGSIGNNTDFFIASQDGTGVRFSATQVLPCSESGAIQNGSRDLGSSSGRFKDLYLSGGVYLGGTGSANHLDDYEEGTWTPNVAGSTTAGTSTFTFVNGSYTKIGNVVTVLGYYRVASATGTGSLRIIGLPFTAASGNNNYAVVTIGETINLAHTSGYTISGYVVPNTAELQITQIDYSGTNTSTSTLPIDAAHDLLFQCTYRTA